MEPATSVLIGEAAKTLPVLVPQLVNILTALANRRGNQAAAGQAKANVDQMRKNLSALGYGLDAYIKAHQELTDIQTECKTLRDFLDENPSLPPGSGKWTTVSYFIKSIQDIAGYYDTLRRNPQGLFELDDLQRIDFVLGDFREALNRADVFSRQKQNGELQGEVRTMAQKAGQVAQIFQERIDTSLLALKKM